ncbi:hypothetical protein Zmor_008063 [Zophobas morio]|uniref:CRAL-TRIO domain-containing protein n=1 Tax=Zophobas morio TaxID=2755281 RepID=A0AA38IUQ8_9CUCU|nr:hypothetical protein Zmor_008063 [Zophobas morio]
MSSKCIEPEKLYSRDPKLTKQDVEIIKEWLKKQPHLPELHETQILLSLHSCYYQIEATKTAIDNYFTVRNLCPEIFTALKPDVLKITSSVVFTGVLPKRTPDGCGILMFKLLDTKTDSFNCANIINLINMVSVLYLHLNGADTGVVALFDMKGFSLGHLTRLNMNPIKHALCLVQEGTPVRIKGIHVMNASPLIDKIMALIKPFLKTEIYNLLQFHTPNSDTLYKSVPKECLPEEYGGAQPSSQTMNEQNMKNILDNYDLLEWHEGQKVDEKKRMGKSKLANDVFGVEGTFKKLEID